MAVTCREIRIMDIVRDMQVRRDNISTLSKKKLDLSQRNKQKKKRKTQQRKRTWKKAIRPGVPVEKGQNVY